MFLQLKLQPVTAGCQMSYAQYAGMIITEILVKHHEHFGVPGATPFLSRTSGTK